MYVTLSKPKHTYNFLYVQVNNGKSQMFFSKYSVF